jgi:hypothetical protein
MIHLSLYSGKSQVYSKEKIFYSFTKGIDFHQCSQMCSPSDKKPVFRIQKVEIKIE